MDSSRGTGPDDELLKRSFVAAGAPAGIAQTTFEAIIHDLRSMLSAVSVSASTIVVGATQGQPASLFAELGHGIQQATAQMDLLLADLQELAAIDGHRTRTRLAPGDLIEVVRSAVEIHHPAATANRLTLAARLPPGPLVVQIDAPRFTRVIANLLINAIKFTPAGGTITVEVAQIGAVVEVAVSDTGPGIAPEQYETIFERFRQGPTVGRVRGVGLGLYIARSIVLAHAGRIWVESVPGQGATFRVRLPTPRR